MSLRLRESCSVSVHVKSVPVLVVVAGSSSAPYRILTLVAFEIPISTDIMPLEYAKKITVENPVVELDGDEMTRIIWKKIREEVRLPLAHPCLS